MGPMNLPWGTWAVFPFILLEIIIVVVWGYLLNKKMQEEGDEDE